MNEAAKENSERPESPEKVSKIGDALPLTSFYALKNAYFLHAAIICTLGVGLLYALGEWDGIPFLIILVSLFAEVWWRGRTPLTMTSEGLECGDECVPWDRIKRYTIWGPVGILFTPFQLQGVILYLADGKSLCVSSRAPGYQPLISRLSRMKFSCEGEWYRYPPGLIRRLQYAIAFAFGIFFVLLMAFKMIVIILVALGASYWIFQKWKKSREQHKKMPKQYFWMVPLTLLLLLYIAAYLFEGYFPLIASLAIIVIVWLPWRPKPFLIFQDALWVGTKRAYSLRHLKSLQDDSKFWVFKFWRLSFANGDVEVLPFLENFPAFKKEIERICTRLREESQVDPAMTIIRSPKEEARYIQDFHQIPDSP